MSNIPTKTSNIPTYPYPLPTAAPEFVTRMQDLFDKRYSVTLTEQEAKELLETLMRLVYLTQLHQLNALHDEIHSLR
ncbi:hypothetical protein [Armatimonas sp.]|uniref:hypothetical protein n=1 Tax=Armatimonas sp. TaxID=1872638 RepID=UPI00374CFCEE